MLSKIKVGDKVRVVRKGVYGHPRVWQSNMDGFINNGETYRVVTIVDNTYVALKDLIWSFPIDSLEKVVEYSAKDFPSMTLVRVINPKKASFNQVFNVEYYYKDTNRVVLSGHAHGVTFHPTDLEYAVPTETYSLPATSLSGRDNLSMCVKLSVKEEQMDRSAPAISNVTLVFGVESDKVTDEQIYEEIRRLEHDISNLNGIEHKPKSLLLKIDEKKLEINSLVEFCNTRSEAAVAS